MTMFLPGGGTISDHRNDYKRYRSTCVVFDQSRSQILCHMLQRRMKAFGVIPECVQDYNSLTLLSKHI